MKDLTEIFYYLGKRINILDLSFYLLIKFAAVVADGVKIVTVLIMVLTKTMHRVGSELRENSVLL